MKKMFMAVDLHSFKLLYVEFYGLIIKAFSICGLLFDPFYRCEIILCHKVYTRLNTYFCCRIQCILGVYTMSLLT